MKLDKNSRSDLLKEVKWHINPELKPMILFWDKPDQGPSLAQLQNIRDMYRNSEPWSDFIIAALNQDSNDRIYKCVNQIRKAWKSNWLSQGCPPLTEIKFDLTIGQERHHISVCLAVQHSIDIGVIPAYFQKIVRALLPEHYLPALGWKNLMLSRPVYDLICQRSGVCDGRLPDRFNPIAQRLHYYRYQPWFDILGCLAGIFIGDLDNDGIRFRHSTNSIMYIITQITRLLDDTWNRCELSLIHNFDIGKELEAQFNLAAKTSEKKAYEKIFQAYQSALAAQKRLGKHYDIRLRDWLLPELNIQKKFDPKFTQRSEKNEQQITKLVSEYSKMVHIIEIRAEFFRDLKLKCDELILKNLQGKSFSFDFEFPLRDGSAVLRFCIYQAGALHSWMTSDKRYFDDEKLVGEYPLLFLGSYSKDGEMLPDPYFCEIHRGYYDKDTRSYLVSRGYRSHDFDAGHSGILFSSNIMKYCCQKYYNDAALTGYFGPVLIDATSFCLGASYGALLALIAMGTGLRAHEILQLQIPSQDETTNSYIKDDSLFYRFYPKGCKPGQRNAGMVEHRLPANLWFYWEDVMRAHRWSGSKWLCIKPKLESFIFLDKGFLLFQANGKPLHPDTMNMLVRFITFGIGSFSKEITLHQLRHVYAEIHKTLGTDMQSLSTAMSHKSLSATNAYLRKEKVKLDIAPFEGTIWDALLNKDTDVK